MQTKSASPSCHEFYFPDVDTLILVETSAAAVVIRATRNTFSEQRKRRFIHELAAEGFIPDDYAWRSLAQSEFSGGVRWVIDHAWLRIDPALTAQTNRLMVRVLAGAALLWLVMMTVLLLPPAR